jgi:hypothetical protein
VPARPVGTLGIVFAGARPAEVDEKPIAEILGHVAAPADHGAGGGGVVLRQDLSPVFGVELLRERCRADEVAEEDGQLATLAGERGVRLGCGRRARSRLACAVGRHRQGPALEAELRPGGFSWPRGEQRIACDLEHADYHDRRARAKQRAMRTGYRAKGR